MKLGEWREEGKGWRGGGGERDALWEWNMFGRVRKSLSAM